MSHIQANLSLYQSSSNLPQELKAKTLALVGFSGLDTVNNAIHKSIWDMFNNRSERAPIRYKIISNTHKFPAVKTKRNSYDWYHPKGILKQNWLSKYLNDVPAIIIIFYDLDWKDGAWNEKMIECASKVQSMRAALEGRDVRIVVVLIQSNLPIPDDPLAAERAIALCSSCELNSQSLYILPHGQHLMGYTIRLENAFLELCQGFYYNCIKNIKMHKDHLDKNKHQFLFVRHQFKIAFLNELRQNVHDAHKHYIWAYNNLMEIRIVDTNALEIRTIAGFINHKICKLFFILNQPRDAITQFKGHVDKFKSRTGFQELIFEHQAWISKQYEIFGDLFDEAVKLGLPAVQTQHPGIYYQQAAQYAIQRKESCHKYCSQVIAYPHPDPLDGMDRLEFYGHRPWKAGKLSGESPDPTTEANGIQALQYLENQVNHSSNIISLFGLAIAQYKIYKCPRTRRELVLQMASECYNSKDFGKALTLLTHMLSDYREEKWWNIISNILEKAIVCAYLTANVQDYLQLALEILGSSVTMKMEDKRRVYENLIRILKKQIPYGDPKLPHDILQNAIILWQPVFRGEMPAIALDMSNILSCIEVKSRFTKSTFEIDQNVSLEVFVRSTCPFPLTLAGISVQINSKHISSEFAVSNDETKNLMFHSNNVKRFFIEFVADSNDVNSEIEIESVNMVIGSSTDTIVNLKFTGQSSAPQRSELYILDKFQKSINFEDIKTSSRAQIVPRESKINVKMDHSPPALVGECYEIIIAIDNRETCGITNLIVEVSTTDDGTQTEFSTVPGMRPESLPLILKSPKTLEKDGKLATSLFLRASKAEIKNLFLKIVYSLDTEKPVMSVRKETVVLPVTRPFEISTRYLSSLMQNIQKFYANEVFGVMPLVQCVSPWPITIEDTSIEFLPPVRSVEKTAESRLAGQTFNKEEIGTELFLAVSDRQSDHNLAIGEYRITWRRQNGNSVTTQVTLHGHHCDWIPLNLKLVTPAHGFVRTPVIINYHFINNSSHLIELNVGMEACDAFMFSGYRQTSISILPFATKILQYNLYPLIAGNVTLPRLVLTIPENSVEGPALRQDQLNQLIDRTVPSYFYVMPQLKGNPSLPSGAPSRELLIN